MTRTNMSVGFINEIVVPLERAASVVLGIEARLWWFGGCAVDVQYGNEG